MEPCQISVQIEVNDGQDFIQNQMDDYSQHNELPSIHVNKKNPQLIDTNFLKEHIPGRTKELNKLIEYLESLKYGHQGPLCISGSTGCGKTSMVNLVLDNIPESYNYRIAYINCIQTFAAKKIYSMMLQLLFDKRSRKPEKQLQKLINQGDQNSHKILVLDEIDQFTDKKSFIYNILEWCQNSCQPFGLILISNMVDLTQKLQSKLRSRVKFNQIIFAPYSYHMLVDILKYKYQKEIKKFDHDAILYLCKRVANDKSDVRILERCFKEILETFCISIQDSLITVNEIQNRLYQGSEQIDEILHDYQFLLDVFARMPKNGDISEEIMKQFRIKYGAEANQKEILYFLLDLRELNVIEIKQNKNSGDMSFEGWGISLKGFFYLLYSRKT